MPQPAAATPTGQTRPSGRPPIRIAYIVSAMPARWIAFEWLSERLDRRRFELCFVLIQEGPPPLAPFLRARGLEYVHVPHRGPASSLRALWRVYRSLRARRIEIVHAHFGIARRVGLLAAVLAGVSHRIHTRHYGRVGLQEVWKPWHTPAAWLSNRLASRVIAPSDIVARLLRRDDRLPPVKVVRIDHGFDLGLLKGAHRDRGGHFSPSDAPVIGVVARYERPKGVQFAIAAFARLLGDYPNAKLVLANASGSYADAIRQRLEALPRSSYAEIPFEPDLVSLYRPFDVFVHVPTSVDYEAFGQVYVEALAAGVPSVFTPAGIAAEFIVDRGNAHLVPVADSEAVYRSIAEILADPGHRRRLIANGLASVEARFGLDRMVSGLETLYLELATKPSQSTTPY